MEGLYFGNEEDEEKEEDDKNNKRVESRPATLLEVLKDDSKEQNEKAQSETAEAEVGDEYRELSEAPLEQVSRVERAAIAQTMAAQRLEEIRATAQEISSEDLAAESFLENVGATGDIDQAYRETLIEVGEADIISSAEEAVEAELALPPDPKDLAEAARDELSNNVDHRATTATNEAIKENPKPVRKSAEKSSSQILDSFVDYLVGRRHGRTSSESHEEVVEKKLREEVSQLRLELTSRESHLRQLAKNRNFENKSQDSPPETIGKVLVKNETAHQEKTKAEVAGISAHMMSPEDLMEIASEVSVENTTLKNIFESHMIGERAMRRVIADYLRGGDYRATLRSELLEHEKDFERDPKLRDHGSSSSVSQRKLSLNDLLEKTGIDLSGAQVTTPPPRVKPARSPVLIQDVVPINKLRRKHHIADIIMIAVILLMAAAIVALLLKR